MDLMIPRVISNPNASEILYSVLRVVRAWQGCLRQRHKTRALTTGLTNSLYSINGATTYQCRTGRQQHPMLWASAFHHAKASPAKQGTQCIEAPSSSREEVSIWLCSKNKGVKALGNNIPHLPLSPSNPTGSQPSPGVATHLFHLVGWGVGPSSKWQIICRRASLHMKSIGTCALHTAKKVIMEILENFKS